MSYVLKWHASSGEMHDDQVMVCSKVSICLGKLFASYSLVLKVCAPLSIVCQQPQALQDYTAAPAAIASWQAVVGSLAVWKLGQMPGQLPHHVPVVASTEQ